MDLVRLVYTGRKTYHDTASGTSWQPGAQQMVPDHAARRLWSLSARSLRRKRKRSKKNRPP